LLISSQAVAYSLKGVILQFRGWAWELHTPYKTSTECYKEPQKRKNFLAWPGFCTEYYWL